MLNTATTSTSAAAVVSGPNHHSSVPVSFKHETKPFHPHPAEMLDPSPSSSAGPIRIDGSEHDAALSKSEFLTRTEVFNRRARRAKQLARIYRDHYWALMEELKLKYRDYYWEYGKSPFVEDEDNERLNSSRADGGSCLAADNGNGNGNLGVNGGNGIGNASSRCGVHGCKAKAMALTRFCHMHILSDAKQKLYKACTFAIKSLWKPLEMKYERCYQVPGYPALLCLSSTTGPILCGKPILKSTVPSYCAIHFGKAEKCMVRALKKSGLNITSTSKLAPKLHVIIAEYVRQIQQKRRTAKRTNLENAEIKEEKNT